NSNKKVEITCAFKSDLKEYWLELLQVNSFADSTLFHPKLMLEDEMGDLSNVRANLNSLCDFAIESRFKNGDNSLIGARIDYLYKNIEKNNWKPLVTEELPKNPRGF